MVVGSDLHWNSNFSNSWLYLFLMLFLVLKRAYYPKMINMLNQNFFAKFENFPWIEFLSPNFRPESWKKIDSKWPFELLLFVTKIDETTKTYHRLLQRVLYYSYLISLRYEAWVCYETTMSSTAITSTIILITDTERVKSILSR